MCFASETGPFFSLAASGRTVLLYRNHPLDKTQKRTVAMSRLESPASGSSLIALIRATSAGFDSVHRSSSSASSHQSDGVFVPTETQSLAQDVACASLSWDHNARSYCFSISNVAETAASTSKKHPISIIPGLAVLLQDEDQLPILTLNLHEAVLTIHTTALAFLSSSAYSLDLAISVLLTLVTHLYRTTNLLAPRSPVQLVPHFEPPPRLAVNSSTSRHSSRSSRHNKTPSRRHARSSRWLPSRSTNQRADVVDLGSLSLTALQSPAASTFSSPYLNSPDAKEIEAAIMVASVQPTLSTPIPSLPPQGVAPELRKEVTGVDLSRFQSFDLSDPELGVGTRAMLRVLYWSFGVMVWILGVGVGVIAASIVAIGSCMGGSKSGRVRSRRDVEAGGTRGA